MNAEEIKNKAAEAMSNAKAKVEAIASNKRVQSAKASLLSCIADTKDWIITNWKVPGWRGKAKVSAAFIVAFFFCRGVFCGWGTSRIEKEVAAMKALKIESDAEHANALREARDDKELREAEAAAHLFGALFGGGNSGSQQDPIPIWTCNFCGKQIQSKNCPSALIRCPSGAGKRCWFTKSN